MEVCDFHTRGRCATIVARTMAVARFSFVFLLATVAQLLTARPAQSFEREWHLGGGVGAAVFADPETQVGPALGVHGAYGLSDMFDLKLEMLASTHTRFDELLWVYGTGLGLAYKVDITAWVPYVGVGVGYYHFFGASPPAPLQPNEAGLSVDLGLDYAVKRNFGVGVQVRYHGFLSEPMESLGAASLFTGLLRAEYRWGW